MDKPAKHLYEFDSFRINAADRLLMKDGEPVGLPPKVFDLLLLLVQNNGSILDKDELMKNLWPDVFVEENNLTVNMSALRKALGESGGQYIQTIPKRGYRFSANVKELWNGEAAVATLNASSNAEEIAPKTDRPRRHAAAVIAALTIAAAIFAFGLYKLMGWNQSRPSSFQEMKITALTNNGRSGAAAISPDGKYVVYAEGESNCYNGWQSLWLRQTATESSSQIVPPADVGYIGLTFSHDGDYIYYVRAENEAGEKGKICALYRIPALGGAAQKLLEGVQTPVTLSPDGKQLAFVRIFRDTGRLESALIVANSDGSGERKLVSRKMPEIIFPFAPSWSPDGKAIAFTGNSKNGDCYVFEARQEDGTQRTIGTKKWIGVGGVAWLADGSGLIVCASDVHTAYDSEAHQMWRLSYPDGEARRITNDLNNYRQVSLTADSNALLAVKFEEHPDVWLAPDGDAGHAKLILPKTNDFTWTPDGRIVYSVIAYSSTMNGNMSMWIMDADGSNKKQLAAEGQINASPSVSPDGRYIGFISDRSGANNIWRMDIDGGNPMKLTNNSKGSEIPCLNPILSPDGRWMVYMSGDFTLWKVPIDGGDSVQVSDKIIQSFGISPDGKRIAYHYRENNGKVLKHKAAVIPFEGGEPIKSFDLPASALGWFIGWTPDGQALIYNSKSNLWSLPLAGGPPQQLTDFKSDKVIWLERSRDGKQLAFVRIVETKDVVLITNFK